MDRTAGLIPGYFLLYRAVCLIECSSPDCQARPAAASVIVPAEYGRNRVGIVEGQEGARALLRHRDRRHQSRRDRRVSVLDIRCAI